MKTVKQVQYHDIRPREAQVSTDYGGNERFDVYTAIFRLAYKFTLSEQKLYIICVCKTMEYIKYYKYSSI